MFKPRSEWAIPDHGIEEYGLGTRLFSWWLQHDGNLIYVNKIWNFWSFFVTSRFLERSATGRLFKFVLCIKAPVMYLVSVMAAESKSALSYFSQLSLSLNKQQKNGAAWDGWPKYFISVIPGSEYYSAHDWGPYDTWFNGLPLMADLVVYNLFFEMSPTPSSSNWIVVFYKVFYKL